LAYTEVETEFVMYIEHMNEATKIPDQVIDSRTPFKLNELKEMIKDVL